MDSDKEDSGFYFETSRDHGLDNFLLQVQPMMLVPTAVTRPAPYTHALAKNTGEVVDICKMSAKSFVIKFGYQSHKEFISTGKRKHTAVCKFCSMTITETTGTTSNFYRHLERKHKERFLGYKAGQKKDDTQPTIASFTQKGQVYSEHSQRQQAISEAIVQDLVIGCCLPLSIVENVHFKHFLEILDSKYTPISRRTISEEQIPALVRKVKEKVLEKLATQTYVSLTTDIWSDRRLRSFLGVTAHMCCKSKAAYALESYLLDCRHFTGRHTGEKIASAFEEITEEYGIRHKINYIITDNASNMKCAFKVHMPQQQSDDSASEEESLDDENLWEDMNSVEDKELTWSSGERLSCFAHSLQLVVNDGLKEVKVISRAIAKTSRFTTLLHSSSQLRDKFEAAFGTTKTIPAASNTRWNSTFKQVQALTALDHRALNEMCSKDYENVVFSAREWNQLKELTSILAPFSEATDLTEAEKSVTISMAVPTVLDLNTHLLKMEGTQMQCRPLVKALHQSLVKRFSGIFTKTNMTKDSGKEEPFNHNVYFLATILDPQFGLSWVDLDVTSGGNAASVKKFRDDLKKTLIGIFKFF
uniref:Zinc finger BED domain-containing protein 4-like n=1 Tax=Paramormyrops kingsleyae TaxID=1676925 RepID=A0A3B3RYJ1_9TELE